MARTRSRPASPPVPGDAGAEVTGEPVQVISAAAAIDVAKGPGMVCLRLPHESRAGRRAQKVREVTATFASVVALTGSPGVPGRGAAGAGVRQRLLAYLVLPGGGGGPGGVAGQRPRRRAPARPPGTGRLDCVWLCKLSERGMLRRSFVPPEPVRDLRALTRLRANLTHDRVRHQNRTGKIPGTRC